MDAEHRRLREESSNLRDLFKRIETAVQKVQFASRAAYVGTDDELQALNDAGKRQNVADILF